MEEKKEFVAPKMTIIPFSSEDVITASGPKRNEIELPDHFWGF